MGKHVVIIEDNANILETLTLLLEDEGYRVSGLAEMSSLEELLALNPDCFILDEQLPFASGHIICMMLKSKPQTKNTPVILMSAHHELHEFASLCNADAFLMKPFADLDSLLNVIYEATHNGLTRLAHSA